MRNGLKLDDSPFVSCLGASAAEISSLGFFPSLFYLAWPSVRKAESEPSGVRTDGASDILPPLHFISQDLPTPPRPSFPPSPFHFFDLKVGIALLNLRYFNSSRKKAGHFGLQMRARSGRSLL